MIYTHSQSSRTFWMTLAVSLAIHASALWLWLPKLKLESPPVTEDTRPDSLVVQLSPAPTPKPPASATAPAPPPSSAPRAVAPPRAAPPLPPRVAAPPPIPAPSAAAPAPAPPVATAPPAAPSRPPPGINDLAAYIEAQRRARAQPSEPAPQQPAVEDENTRANRIARSNIAVPRPMFGFGPNKAYGTFTTGYVGDNYAEFTFYGWSKERKVDIAQPFEVRKGNNSDIYIAIVRKIISIVREQVDDNDIQWQSRRLGRSVTLSVLPKDNATFEEFVLQEILYDLRRAAR